MELSLRPVVRHRATSEVLPHNSMPHRITNVLSKQNPASRPPYRDIHPMRDIHPRGDIQNSKVERTRRDSEALVPMMAKRYTMIISLLYPPNVAT